MKSWILFVFIILSGRFVFADQTVSESGNSFNPPLTSVFTDAPTFQDFNKKIEKIGLSSTTILPENSEVWIPIIDGGPISMKDAYFSRKMNAYFKSYNSFKNFEGLLKGNKTPVTESEIANAKDAKKAKVDFLSAQQELKFYKQAHPLEFSKLVERVRIGTNEKGWGFTLKTLAEIREDGLESDDPLLNLLADPNGIFADLNLKIKKNFPDEVNGEPQVKPEEKFTAPIKDQETCHLKAMNPYKREIMRTKSGYYYGGLRDKSVLTSKEPCLLLDLSFKISKNPFKRTLSGANILDMKGNKKSLIQSDFDTVLNHWETLKKSVSDLPPSNVFKPATRTVKGAH